MMNGQDIRAYRARHDLTQKQLAEMLGLTDTQMINRWERGKIVISGSARILMLLLIADDTRSDMHGVAERLVEIATDNFRDSLKRALTPI